MSVVEVEVAENIGVIRVDNPPVNAISQAVRAGLLEAAETIAKNDVLTAVVLLCRGRTFMAGADIREFGGPPLKPDLPDVIAAIEALDIPVIAAIHGQALGGGLEIALGCHYRIAAPGTRLGLPEVTLGIIPGSGGTQRLPRLIGVKAALPMIATGRPVSAEEALKSGLVDKVVDGDLRGQALAFAASLDAGDLASRRQSTRDVPGEAPEGLLDDWRDRLARRHRGVDAPQACIDAVEFALTLPFEEGIVREREVFLSLRGSEQAAALRHIFFAERASGKIEGDAHPRTVVTVGVVGAGTMGAGIALVFAGAGLAVTLLEQSPQALKQGMARITRTLEGSVARGRLSESEAQAQRQQITPTTAIEDLSDADLVVEAVFEDLDVKRGVFRDLDRVCKTGTILATNTSYLDIDALADATGRPRDVVGMHFFSPAHVMRLVEVVRTDATGDDVLATVLRQVRALRKVGVVARVGHGFIGNRLYQGYQREAGLMLLEGASPAEIDRALYEFGMAMGPFAVADLSGLDIGYAMRRSLSPDLYEAQAFLVHDRLVELGRKGRKADAGFYRYRTDGGAPDEDVEVAELIAEVAAEQGVERREISSKEIVERCLLAIVAEGARVLDEGIAARASDIDVVFVNGYGFPRHRGGPMHFAEQMGLAEVQRKVEAYADRFGPRWWSVAESLARAAQEGGWD